MAQSRHGDFCRSVVFLAEQKKAQASEDDIGLLGVVSEIPMTWKCSSAARQISS